MDFNRFYWVDKVWNWSNFSPSGRESQSALWKRRLGVQGRRRCFRSSFTGRTGGIRGISLAIKRAAPPRRRHHLPAIVRRRRRKKKNKQNNSNEATRRSFAPPWIAFASQRAITNQLRARNFRRQTTKNAGRARDDKSHRTGSIHPRFLHREMWTRFTLISVNFGRFTARDEIEWTWNFSTFASKWRKLRSSWGEMTRRPPLTNLFRSEGQQPIQIETKTLLVWCPKWATHDERRPHSSSTMNSNHCGHPGTGCRATKWCPSCARLTND